MIKFLSENKIETRTGCIIESNILNNLEIAAKSNKKLLRTAILSYLMLGLKDESYEDITCFFDKEVNGIVNNYVSTYLPDIDFEYVKDLKIEEFEYVLANIKLMDVTYQKVHEIATNIVNNYSNSKIFIQLSLKPKL